MLRKKIQHEILQSLSRSSFTIDDFEIDFKPSSSGGLYREEATLAVIRFKHESGYYFSIIEKEKYKTDKIDSTTSIDRESRRRFGAIATVKAMTLEEPTKTVETREIRELISKYDFTTSPGQEKSIETESVMNLYRVDSAVSAWVKLLKEELSYSEPATSPDLERKQKIKDALAIHLEPYINDRDSRFTRAEASDISKKMLELFEAIQDTQTLLDKELKELKALIENVNESLNLYKKGTWYETTLNRLSQWSSGVESVEKLIGAIVKIGDLIT